MPKGNPKRFPALDLSCFQLAEDALLDMNVLRRKADAVEESSDSSSEARPPGCASSNIREMSSAGGEAATKHVKRSRAVVENGCARSGPGTAIWPRVHKFKSPGTDLQKSSHQKNDRAGEMHLQSA